MLCFALGYFQRGKAKAPHQVNPPKIITTKELKLQIKLALSHRDILKELMVILLSKILFLIIQIK